MKPAVTTAAVLLILLLLLPATPTAAQLLLARADMGAALTTSYDDDLHVTVHNHGPDDASGRIDVTLPAGLQLRRLPTGCEGGGATFTCTTDVLLPDSYTTFPVDVAQVARGTQRVEATVTSSLQDPRSGNDRAAVALTTLAAPPAEADVVAAAVATSQMRFPGTTSHAVLTRADAFADALAGSALAGDAPLLLTGREALDDRTAAELDRVLAAGATVYLLGGEQALAPAVADAVAALGLTPVRLAGPSRVGTAVAVAEEVRRTLGDHGRAILARANGERTSAWADSIAVGGVAAATGTPVLLTDPARLSPEVAAWLDAAEVTSTTVVGGTAAVADAVLAALPSPTRVAGPDRAATAAAIADLYPARRSHAADGFHLVDGWAEDGWAHGLLAAGLAADTDAPVLYVAGGSAPGATTDAVTSCRDHPVPLAPVGPQDDRVRAELDELDADDC